MKIGLAETIAKAIDSVDGGKGITRAGRDAASALIREVRFMVVLHAIISKNKEPGRSDYVRVANNLVDQIEKQEVGSGE